MASFGEDLVAVVKSRGTVILCGIFASIITARYLGPQGNGIIASLVVFPDLFMIIGSLGIRQAAAYFIGQKKFPEKNILSAIFFLWIVTSIFCVAACYALIQVFSKTDFDNELIVLALVPIPFSLFSTYASGVFLGKNNIKAFNTVNWIPNVVKLICYIVLIVLIPLAEKGALIGIFLGYFILSIFVLKLLKKEINFKWDYQNEVTISMVKMGVIYAISLLIISLNYKVDIVLLEKLSSQTEVGIYTKGVSIVEYLWEVPTLLSTIVFARSATSSNPREFSLKVSQLLRICLVIVSIASILFFFLSDFIMVLMYGEQFRASATVQKILLPGILLLTIFKVLNMDLAGQGKPWLAIWAMIPGLVINIILNYLWNEKYGANGAAMASTISYMICAIIFIFVYSIKTKIELKDILKFQRQDFDFINDLKRKYFK